MTIGEAAVKVLRVHGRAGATAAEVASELRAGSMAWPRFPEASTPNVGDRLRKYARHGAVRVEYSTSGGNEFRPAEHREVFFA